MLNAAQCRAARALLDWPRERLAEGSRVALRTIVDFERGARDPREVTLAAIRGALEGAGVIFVEENGEGSGVRLKKVVSDAALDHKIAAKEAVIAEMPVRAEPSPDAALAKMDKAMAEDDLVKLKNARTRRKGAPRKP